MLHAQKEIEKFKNSAVMEGYLSIRAVISGRESGVNDRKILRVLYDKDKARARRREIDYLKRKAVVLGFEISAVSAEEIDKLTIGGTHGGVVALCSNRSFPNVSLSDIENGGFYIMLEGIEDPYNFGYALRSAYAAGADGVLLSERNWMSAAGTVARASAGASEMMKIHVGSPEETIRIFKNAKYKIYAADNTSNSENIYDVDASFPILLAVGGERRGLSAPVLASADKVVRLDYGRKFPAALSAASAASILAFEIFRQNRGKND